MGYTGKLENLQFSNCKIALKINLKAALTKKMRLHVWGYSQGKFLYLLTESGLTMKYKIYGNPKTKDIVA